MKLCVFLTQASPSISESIRDERCHHLGKLPQTVSPFRRHRLRKVRCEQKICEVDVSPFAGRDTLKHDRAGLKRVSVGNASSGEPLTPTHDGPFKIKSSRDGFLKLYMGMVRPTPPTDRVKPANFGASRPFNVSTLTAQSQA